MPIGIQRFNDTSHHPNDRVAFIKPLIPTSAIAEDYLKRIAAIVYPLMKNHGMDIMSLNEFEPNREFLGRNWNAGECIELVLKDLKGNWLPFRYVLKYAYSPENVLLTVQCCMNYLIFGTFINVCLMIRIMSHSKAFWKFYNTLRLEMKILLDKGYTGEGIYARGYSLSTSETFDHHVIESDIPEVVCGGVYRKKRKRKRNVKETTGALLGENQAMRIGIENKNNSAKPRVAKSKRGRDLRAAAAEMRLLNSVDKQETEQYTSERVVDGQDEVDKMKLEMKEIIHGTETDLNIQHKDSAVGAENCLTSENNGIFHLKSLGFVKEKTCNHPILGQGQISNSLQLFPSEAQLSKHKLNSDLSCHVCTTFHQGLAPMICSTCSCVLQSDISKDLTWNCGNSDCLEIGYVSHIDIGICGLCGSPRQ